MNDKSRLKGSLLNGGGTKVFRFIASRVIRAALVTLGAAMALVLLSGCASVPVHGDSDPWKYNPSTGYPAVGAGLPPDL
jgi:hypothetical protein